ncbi:PucR family transcriptional regulator ligand-binding domain-containing protein [Fodinisporobacter ferrooxydans]|uniref:PucR family transcriptional regulator ligand-binding domain-containing protein n=1 Tax=Fodinisporobacter ferrooxydans TaxID=2901836 RepID=A0ABY4CL12_9BACL|nr:PucR family transcriptional regulator ligand-binding domain-containing protein [Alicyclobacillaceae bacterium MYW30-H2]
MPFTLRDVLDIEILKPAKVRTAVQKLEMIQVEWISVMEYPVENYIRKNEFVLSTAIGCNENLSVFQSFVLDVIQSGATALAIALGRYIQDIPPEILQLAEELDFPIIELPWEIRFSDITHSVLSKLNNWQRNLIDQAEELQKQLLHLFLTNGTLSQATELIRKKINLPIVIVDKEGNIKGKSKNSESLIEKWECYQQSVSTATIGNSTDFHSYEVKWVSSKDSIIQASILTHNIVNGFLLIEPAFETVIESFLTNGSDHFLEYAATATALWFQKEATIKETELRLRDDFVWSFAKGEFDSWDSILSRAKLLEYNVNLPGDMTAEQLSK